MCFEKVFKALFGGGDVKEPVAPIVTSAPPVAPAAPPVSPADPPSPNNAKSGELDSLAADKVGFGALIIPRTSIPGVTRNVPGG